MNLLLNVFTDFWNNFVERIQIPAIIVALVFAIVGVSFAVLGRRIARVIRKTDDIKDTDNILIAFKAVGLVCLFVSVLIIIFRSGV
jgi:hypothetical protein